MAADHGIDWFGTSYHQVRLWTNHIPCAYLKINQSSFSRVIHKLLANELFDQLKVTKSLKQYGPQISRQKF